MKNKNKKTNLKDFIKSLNLATKFIFFLAVGVTLAAMLFTWISVGQPWKIDSLKEMKQVNFDNYLNQSDEYYVFIYNTKEDVEKEFTTKVVEYAEAARTSSSLTKIYAYNYSVDDNIAIVTDLKLSSTDQITRLLVIKDGKVTSNLYKWSDVLNKLEQSKN